MIRYVSQKQVDLANKSKRLKQHSQELLPGVTRPSVEGAEDEENSSKALRQLKRINDHKQALKGRLSVLQLHEEKSDFRAFLNDHRYQFHQQMRDQMEKQRQEKAMNMHRNYLQLLHSQDKARKEREDHRNSLRKAQEEISDSKGSDYKTTKQRSEELQRSLSMAKQEENQTKRRRKDEIREYEKNQREKVQSYLKNKMIELKASDLQSVQKVSRVKEERAKQIQELARLESIMLEKQARSKMTRDESQRKLRQFLAMQKPQKALSTSHTTKLPALSSPRHQRTQQTEQEIMIL